MTVTDPLVAIAQQDAVFAHIAAAALNGDETPATKTIAEIVQGSAHVAERVISALVKQGRIVQIGTRTHKVFAFDSCRTVSQNATAEARNRAWMDAEKLSRIPHTKKWSSDVNGEHPRDQCAAFGALLANAGAHFQSHRFKSRTPTVMNFSTSLTYGVPDYGR